MWASLWRDRKSLAVVRVWGGGETAESDVFYRYERKGKYRRLVVMNRKRFVARFEPLPTSARRGSNE